MAMDEKERPFKSLDLIFDLAREKLQSQSDHWRAIDQNNAIIIAVYVILLAMVATIDKSIWSWLRSKYSLSEKFPMLIR